MYKLLQKELRYVNPIGNGDKAIIELSGFNASKEPLPHAIPDAPLIKKVVEGKTPNSAKIILVPMGRGLFYTIETTTTPDDENSWKTELLSTNSKKLVLEDLNSEGKIFIRIAAGNARGQGDWSEIKSFISQ